MINWNKIKHYIKKFFVWFIPKIKDRLKITEIDNQLYIVFVDRVLMPEIENIYNEGHKVAGNIIDLINSSKVVTQYRILPFTNMKKIDVLLTLKNKDLALKKIRKIIIGLYKW